MRNFAGCCSSGAPGPDDYQPAGQLHNIGGVTVYDSKPPLGANTSQSIVLLLPDGFGQARHNYILADRFAEQGWRTILPDYFEGDSLPIWLLGKNPNTPIDDHDWTEDRKAGYKAFDLDQWIKRHPHDYIEKLLQSLIASLRQESPSAPLLGVGYCFGGKHVFRLAKWALKVAVAFHPSFVTSDDVRDIGIPCYAGLAELDNMVPESLPNDLRAWASDYNIDLVLDVYPEVKHGFAARPEAKDSKDRSQYEAAFARTITFFQSIS